MLALYLPNLLIDLEPFPRFSCSMSLFDIDFANAALLFPGGQTRLVRDAGDNPVTVHSSSCQLSDIVFLRPG